MPKEVTISCDGCGDDLTSTGNEVDYRLALESQRLPIHSNLVTQMGAYPAIKKNAYFCDLRCLRKWIDELDS